MRVFLVLRPKLPLMVDELQFIPYRNCTLIGSFVSFHSQTCPMSLATVSQTVSLCRLLEIM